MELVDEQVKKLLDRVRREVDDGLLPSCQISLGYGSEVVMNEVFGDADLETRYCLFSATKPFVAGVVWHLVTEGSVDVSEPVVTYIPEFDANGKGAITVEQVMLHTSGFPSAPMGPEVWSTSESRREAFTGWRLNWEPGTRFEYHATSAHWVLAEIIEEVTGNDYRDEVERRVTDPLGLPRLLGLDDQINIAELVLRGEHASPDELEKAYGVRELPITEVTDEAIIAFNASELRELGMPGGGGYGRACDLALFYQGLLHNPDELWDPALLADVTGRVRNNLPSPEGVPACRSLGMIIAGDDGMSNLRGMGRTVSPTAFGHNGAGGQLAWVDPVSGISLGYVTNGYDCHEVRRPRRDTAIASLAGLCASPS